MEAQVQMGKPNNFGFNWFLSNWTTLFFGQKWSVQLDMDMVYSWTLGPFDIPMGGEEFDRCFGLEVKKKGVVFL